MTTSEDITGHSFEEDDYLRVGGEIVRVSEVPNPNEVEFWGQVPPHTRRARGFMPIPN